jgi:membrane protease YdiL (CAAX protease family)
MFHLPVWLLLLDLTAKSILFTWVFLHTRGSVLIAMLFHGATNLFLVSPEVVGTGDFQVAVLAMVGKWVLVGIVLVVAGPRLVRDPRPDPETLPRTSVTTAPTVGVSHTTT